jgi:RNA polymerase sigma-70 factor (ECF subfamily)
MPSLTAFTPRRNEVYVHSDPRDQRSGENPAPPSDGVLVAAARRGDMRAFEALYRMHCGKVMGLCLRMVRERDAAEDCVQQTFIKAWQNLGMFEGRSSFSTWLHSIAVHVAMTHLRSRKSWLEYGNERRGANDEPDGGHRAAFDEPLVTDTGALMDMEKALLSLPDGARCVVVLQAIYGYSHEEVAGLLGIAVGTCKAQLHRARQLLRSELRLESSHE